MKKYGEVEDMNLEINYYHVDVFSHVAQKMGYEIKEEQLEVMHKKFLAKADEKKEIYDYDVMELLEKETMIEKNVERNLWKLEDFQMKIGMADYSAEICVSKNGKTMRTKEKGNGAIDAMYSAILTACDIPAEIMDYRIQNLGKQKEALGKVVVEIAYAEQVYYGKAIEYDVMRASALALINALNKIVLQEK